MLGLRLGFLCFIWATTTIVLAFCVLGLFVLVWFFNGQPGFSPVKTKGICMYFQRSVSSSLTRSLQGFALQRTEHFQHCCSQREGDASPPRLLSRSDCENKHIMALQTLSDATVSIGLSRTTAICKHPWHSASDLRGDTEREGKGSQT